MNNFNYTNLKPFKWFILENFPYIEADIDALTNWQLFCKLGEEMNKIIEKMNLAGQQTEDLTKAFNELKNYIDNYFENLDVQEEVNKKLDIMAQDGTLEKIINEELLQEINNNINVINNSINDINNNINDINNSINILNTNTNKMNKIRKKYNNKYDFFKLPAEFNIDFFKQLNIYHNGEKFVTDLDVSIFKNKNSTHTYYVSPSGNDENDGLSRNTPFSSLLKAYQQSISGDTIILLEGIYNRQNATNISNPSIKRSINIIGEGRVILTQRDSLNWQKNDMYNNVYQADRSNIYEVIDFSNINNNSTNKLKQVSTLAECSQTENSFYYENNQTIYVHMFNDNIPSDKNIDCALVIGDSPLKFDEQIENLNIYLENLILLDGYNSNLLARNYKGFTCNIYAKNCKFFNSYKTSSYQDSVCLQGANGIFQNCICSFGGKDGFNYHALNNIKPLGIEINCEGSYCGLENSENDNSYNGSSAHDGSKVLRIGGIYHNNKGPNVADVQNNTASINFECISYDSNAKSGTNENSDFFTSQGNTQMYLYNCYCKDSKSEKQINALDTSTIHLYNTEYNTKNGNIIDI